LKEIKKNILDILFPISCLSCETEGFWVCDHCFSKIPLLDFQFCPNCEERITEKGLLCPACRKSGKSFVDLLIAASSYENETVRKMIHNLKYRFAAGIADPLSGIMTKALLKHGLPIPDFIVPVPLHPRRLRWRGFNQSLLLAEKIAEELIPPLKIRVLNALKRQKYNRPQVEISNYSERFENVKDVFSLGGDSPEVRSKTILLVDDIATTGATLEKCAKALKEAGAKKVFAVVVARQSISQKTDS
jgi:ComF family protein